MSAREPDLLAIAAKAWRETVPIPPRPNQSWAEAGGDSLATLNLLLRLEIAFGRKLSFDVVAPDMTVEELASSLARSAGEAAPSGQAVFLLPGILGDGPDVAALRRSLAGRVSFATLALPGLEQPASVIGDMAATGRLIADEIIRRQPHGAIILAGFSFGGSVAFEAAQQLVACGREVAWLAVLDTLFDQIGDERRGVLHGLPVKLLRNGGSTALRPLLAIAPSARLMRLRRLLLRHFRSEARKAWRPKPLAAAVLLAASDQFAPLTVPRWQSLCPRLTVLRLAGGHGDIFAPRSLELLAPAFEQAVGQVQAVSAHPETLVRRKRSAYTERL